MDKMERLIWMEKPLLSWYQENRRYLPWREEVSPYRTWISEIMLQQTRVEAVKPYFERFMAELPDIKALAMVEEDRLLKLWEGLGYYSRARNLKKAAEQVMEEYGGRMPGDYGKLLKLPGIGSYTAGAIASIAFGIPVPAVDGNVLRVISRVTADRSDILSQSVKKQMEADLKAVMPEKEPGIYNQALIELGALVCIPNGQPKCGECPLKPVCLTEKQGLFDEIPYKAPKKKRRIEEKTVLLLECGAQIALRKRDDKGLLASLYEYPNLEHHLGQQEVLDRFGISYEDVAAVEELPWSKHIFSHIEWHMTGYRIVLREPASLPVLWVEKEKLKRDYPVPGAFQAYTRLIAETGKEADL